MKEFKIKAWLKKENKMVAIIGIDLSGTLMMEIFSKMIIKLLNLKI